MRIETAVLFAVLLIGCDASKATTPNDAAVDGPAALTGTATVDGTVENTSLTALGTVSGAGNPFRYGFQLLDTQFTMVAISGFVDFCDNTNLTVSTSLYLNLFENVSTPLGAVSTVSAPGQYAVWLPGLSQSAPPPGNLAVVEFTHPVDFGGAISVAESGQVTIDVASDGELAGSFDVTFSNGHLSGTFRSPRCATWSRNDSVPTVHP